jgi:hypothetical protein
MHFMQLLFCTDAFAGQSHLSAEERAGLAATMIENGTLDLRDAVFDVTDVTETIATMVDADLAEIGVLTDA